MKSLREILSEAKQFQSEHEPVIREIASKARRQYMIDTNQKNPNRKCHFGECDAISTYVSRALREKYPSAQTTGPGGSHSWVAIPEIDHYVDPSYDQFKDRSKLTKEGHFHNHSVKIGQLTTRFDDKNERFIVAGHRLNNMSDEEWKDYWKPDGKWKDK